MKRLLQLVAAASAATALWTAGVALADETSARAQDPSIDVERRQADQARDPNYDSPSQARDVPVDRMSDAEMQDDLMGTGGSPKGAHVMPDGGMMDSGAKMDAGMMK